MKKRFQVLLMILALGVFITPKQILLAQTTQMSCCKSENRDNNRCHNKDQKQEDCSKNQSHHKGCSGNCCTNCGSCNTFVYTVLKPDHQLPLLKQFIQNNHKGFRYSDPFISTSLQEIWQPPKIG